MEGDVYDPSGQLTGGSKPKTSGILNHVSELLHLQLLVSNEEAELRKIDTKIEELMGVRERYNSLKSSLELTRHEYNILNNTIHDNASFKLIEEANQLESSLSSLKTQHANLIAEKANLMDECARVEKDIHEYSELSPEKLRELSVRFYIVLTFFEFFSLAHVFQ